MMYDVAIVGAGPAGASAAIFTAKAEKKTLMFDNNMSVTRRAWLRNHYGAPDINGPDLVDTGKKQAAQFGAEIVEAAVENVTKHADHFDITTDNGNYQAKSVLIATGMYTDLAEKIGLRTKPGTEPRIKTILDLDVAGKTNIDGIWGAGTIAGVSMHTIITAGDGARVAINMISEMNGQRYVDHDVMKS